MTPSTLLSPLAWRYGLFLIVCVFFSPLAHPQETLADMEKLAIPALIKKAESGNQKAQWALAARYGGYGNLIPKDLKKSAYWAQKAAEQGEPEAQRYLAGLYLDGNGVTKDEKKAFAWYRKAAENGSQMAQYFLGISYRFGEGLSQNGELALYWLKRCAKQGYLPAQMELAYMYEYGKGTQKNLVKAYQWYTIALTAPPPRTTHEKPLKNLWSFEKV